MAFNLSRAERVNQSQPRLSPDVTGEIGAFGRMVLRPVGEPAAPSAVEASLARPFSKVRSALGERFTGSQRERTSRGCAAGEGAACRTHQHVACHANLLWAYGDVGIRRTFEASARLVMAPVGPRPWLAPRYNPITTAISGRAPDGPCEVPQSRSLPRK
jgi:hypothetical protein